MFGDYYALSVTQLFAFSDKHAAFERNGNMSLFEKFELAREVSEICDSVVPLIKVVIVEGGSRGDGTAVVSDDVMAAVQAAAAGHRRSCNAVGCRDNDAWRKLDGNGGKHASVASAQQSSETCRNPFGAIMEDDVDRTTVAGRKNSGKQRKSAAASKSIELKVYSRSVNYFHEQVDEYQPLRVGILSRRSSQAAVA